MQTLQSTIHLVVSGFVLNNPACYTDTDRSGCVVVCISVFFSFAFSFLFFILEKKSVSERTVNSIFLITIMNNLSSCASFL